MSRKEKAKNASIILPRTTPTEQIVLLAIGDRRMYGLDLISRIKRVSRGRYDLSVGSLYPVLQSLEEKGLVDSEWGDETTGGARRKYHRCNNSGAAVIKEFLEIQQLLLHAE